MYETTIRAKAFGGRIETIRVRVDDDGSILVWDDVAAHFTRCHSLAESAQRHLLRDALRAAHAREGARELPQEGRD